MSNPQREDFDLPHLAGVAPGFSWIAKQHGFVFLSGQIGIDENRVIAADFESQVRQAFKNVDASLRLAGATPADIIQMLFFLKMRTERSFLEDMRAVGDIKDEVLPGAVPVGTTTRVVELFLPEVLFEVQVTAAVSEG